MAKPVVIGAHSFPTQLAGLNHFKAILHHYKDGDRISDPNHYSDLVALIERFDDVLRGVGEIAKGDGQVSRIEKRKNTGTGWSSSGFWIVRQDGTETDFSYIDAVKGKPKGASQDFYSACREAVALDLILAKKNAFALYGDSEGQVECELTGKKIAFDDAHLDHAWPYFSQIVCGFRAARGWSKEIPEGIVTPPRDRQTKCSFVDAAVANAFRDYHNSQAELRILSKQANLSKASAARKPKIARPVRI